MMEEKLNPKSKKIQKRRAWVWKTNATRRDEKTTIMNEEKDTTIQNISQQEPAQTSGRTMGLEDLEKDMKDSQDEEIQDEHSNKEFEKK